MCSTVGTCGCHTAHEDRVLGPVAWRTPPLHYGPWEQITSSLAEGLVLFIVDQAEQAIIVELGEPKGQLIARPGLYWKKPFIQVARRFDKRQLRGRTPRRGDSRARGRGGDSHLRRRVRPRSGVLRVLRTLESYSKSIGSNTTLMIRAGSELFKYLQDISVRRQ